MAGRWEEKGGTVAFSRRRNHVCLHPRGPTASLNSGKCCLLQELLDFTWLPVGRSPFSQILLNSFHLAGALIVASQKDLGR